MLWVLLSPDGVRLASGSWQGVIDEGHELGVITSDEHPEGIQMAPRKKYGGPRKGRIHAAYIVAPAGMFPETDAPPHADSWY